MRKIMITIMLMLILILTACNPTGEVVKKIENKEIKIGVPAILTGPGAVYGQGMKRGVEVAIDEINSKGGVNGYMLKPIYEDTIGEVSNMVTIVKKMTSIDEVDALIGSVGSAEVLGGCKIADDSQTPFIMLGTASSITTDCGDYTFRVLPSDAYQGEIVAKKAYNLGYRNAAIIYMNNQYGSQLMKTIKKSFAELGGKIVYVDSVEEGESDFRGQVTKINPEKIDVIFFPVYIKEGIIFLKQMHDLEVDIDIISTELLKDVELINLGGESVEGIKFTFPSSFEGPTSEDFKEKFMVFHGGEPEIFSDSMYDATHILADAMELCENPKDRVCVKNNLYKTDYLGASGNIVFDENGDVISKSYDFFEVKNGEFVKLS
jgi:branched-chain amino acid transport system substrate-binding protein